MRTLGLLFSVLLLALMSIPGSKAGLDFAAPAPPSSELELVVMEAEGCTYCALFRRDVLPAYQASERAKDVPIRFVDINDIDEKAMSLEGAIDMVPTFVVLKNRKEIGRISGYVGPEFFFHSINHAVSGAP